MGPRVTRAAAPRRTLWVVTRKHPPAVGGMEELSYRITSALRTREPVTLVKLGGGQAALVWFVPYALFRVLVGAVRHRISALMVGDPVLAVVGALAHRLGVPVATVVHGLDITWPNRTYQAYLRAFFFGRCDLYVCISTHVRDLVRARRVVDSQIEVVPPGVAAAPATDAAWGLDFDPLLLFVGRLVRRKGVAWLVSAVLPALAERFPRLGLVVAGHGPEHGAIVEAARAAGIAPRVRNLGPVSDAAKWSLYARCDLVVMPNVKVEGDVEGFGLVALEASAAGKPVAAADLEGLRDAVEPGQNGWRFAPENAQAWIDGLTALLSDRSGLSAMGERARAFAARFDWDIVGDRYAAIAARLGSQ